jgi:hypothetical protein
MKQNCFLIAMVLLQGIVHAQTPNPGQPLGGGGTPTNNNLTVQASPSADLPLGEKVTLTLSGHAQGDGIAWWKSCHNDPFTELLVTGGDCGCSTNPDGKVGFPGIPEIFDSPTTSGAYKYEAHVGNKKASTVVTIHPPNGSDTIIGPLSPFTFPIAGNKQVQYQTMKTTLKWNGTPLGKCAAVCCREKVKIIPDPAYEDRLKFLRFEHADWVPTPCLTHEYYGDANSQGVWTLKWDSPSLLDKNWHYWTLDQWEYIQTLPVGTVLATRQHRYQFEGSICSGFSWGPLNAEIWLKYVIRRVKNTDGTLREPPKNVAEWRIISNPGPM